MFDRIDDSYINLICSFKVELHCDNVSCMSFQIEVKKFMAKG